MTIKKRKKSSSQSQSTIPLLPDDLLSSCFARVSRLYYPTLSLVSKKFRSLLASHELYKARSLLGRTESCLYVCLRFPSDRNKPRLFTLCLRPNQTLTNDTKKKKSSGYVLAPISVPDSPYAHWSALVAIGYNIYNIGGSMFEWPSSRVSILDCRSHTWHEAPSMRDKRFSASATVLDGKIYVKRGSNSSHSMEFFDPKTQTWELGSFKSAEIKEPVYVCRHDDCLAYEQKEGRWDMVAHWGGGSFSFCVIENVLYYYYLGDIKWYDTKVRLWKVLDFLVELPNLPVYASVKLADYGGMMVVLWDKYMDSCESKDKMIWCTMIALGRHNDGEIWGKVEWCNAVLIVPESCQFVYALAATI